jgi:hypothetical protein
VQHHRCRPSETCPFPLTRPLLLRHQQPFFAFAFVYPILPIGQFVQVTPVALCALPSRAAVCFFLFSCIASILSCLPRLSESYIRPPFPFHSSACYPLRVTVSLCSSPTNKLLASPATVLPPSSSVHGLHPRRMRRSLISAIGAGLDPATLRCTTGEFRSPGVISPLLRPIDLLRSECVYNMDFEHAWKRMLGYVTL